MMPEGNERIHRFADAKVSDFQVGQIMVLPNSTGLKSAVVVFGIRSDGEEVELRVYPATENNKAEARQLRAAD